MMRDIVRVQALLRVGLSPCQAPLGVALIKEELKLYALYQIAIAMAALAARARFQFSSTVPPGL